MHEAILWESAGDRVQCLLCPHACRIADGSRGVCGVRENDAGRLVALTYGKVSSLAVDPIEKKPVFHFHPGSLAFSLGSVGCTFRCGHCQNWQISRATPEGLGEELRFVSPEEAVRLAQHYDCQGVAFTYNEPVIWIEYVIDVARLAKAAGLYTVMVTNGWITEAGLDALGGLIDVWRVDVKGFDDAAYGRLCKVPHVAPILDAAVRAKRHWGMHVEVVTNVVPTVNDDDETLTGIARWVFSELGADTPWHITRFFPYLDFADVPPTPLATLRHARDIGRAEGLHFVYLGNIDEPGGEDTTCPGCGRKVIGRDGYRIVERRTLDGACESCGARLNMVE